MSIPAHRVAGIYLITGPTGEYVGQSWHIPHRWRRHKTNLRRGVSTSKILQRAWDKYGEAAFAFSILEIIPNPTKTLLDTREQYYVDARHSVYNIRRDVRSNTGVTYGSETRALVSSVVRLSWQNPVIRARRMTAIRAASSKHSRSALGRRPSERSIALLRERNRTRQWSDAQRAHMARIKTGLKQSLETIAKRVEKLRGRKDSPETRHKKSIALMGHPVSQAQRDKQRQTVKGRPLTQAQRDAYAARRGIPLSEEHRRKSIATLQKWNASPEGREAKRRAMIIRWNGKALSAEVVVAIRMRYAAGDVSQRTLAKDYGISLSQVNRIIRGLSHGDIERR